MTIRSIVWYRNGDLRVADHAALAIAMRDGEAIPVYVVDEDATVPGGTRSTAPRTQFLNESLDALETSFADRGSTLLVVPGESVDVIPRLAERWRVDRVVAQQRIDPVHRERDRRIASALRVPLQLQAGATLLSPGTLRTAAGRPYSVFTAFARAFLRTANDIGSPIPAPRTVPRLPSDVECPEAVRSPSLHAAGIRWDHRLLVGGEAEAVGRLRAFLAGPAATYREDRDRMDLDGTSRLSADLAFGTISPRAVWTEVRNASVAAQVPASTRLFRNQQLWRRICAYDPLGQA